MTLFNRQPERAPPSTFESRSSTVEAGCRQNRIIRYRVSETTMCGILFLFHQNKDSTLNQHVNSSVANSQGDEVNKQAIFALLNALILPLNRRGPDAPVAPATSLNPLFSTCICNGLLLEGYLQCAVLHVRGERIQRQPIVDNSVQSGMVWNGEIFNFQPRPETVPPVFDLRASDTLMLWHQISNILSADYEAGGDDACFNAMYLLLSTIEGPFAVIIRHQDKIFFARDCFGRRSLLWSSFISGNCATESIVKVNTSFLALSSCAPQLSHMDSTGLKVSMSHQVPHHGLFCMQLSASKAAPAEHANDAANTRELRFRPWNMFNNYFQILPCANKNIADRLAQTFEILDATAEDDVVHRANVSKRRKQVLESFIEPTNAFLKTSHCRLRLDASVSDSTTFADENVSMAKSVLNFINLSMREDDEQLFNLALSNSDIVTLVEELEQHLTDAVRRRCSDFHRRIKHADAAYVAVLFSGGLDSTILAVLLHRLLPLHEPIALHNVAFYAVASSNAECAARACACAPDRITAESAYATLLAKFPERRWILRRINVSRQELELARSQRIAHLIYPNNTVLDDSLGCVLWFASAGFKGAVPPLVVFSGLGADELFGGYSRHLALACSGSWNELEEELSMDLARLGARNCGRDDRVVSDHGCELRMPFLDESFVEFCMKRVPVRLKILLNGDGVVKKGTGDKFLLRLFAHSRLGLSAAAREPKRAMQFGTRIAKLEKRGEHADEPCERLIQAVAGYHLPSC